MAPRWKPVKSLSDIARQSGMSLTTISKMYYGTGKNRRRPSMDAACRIAAAQGITVDQLLKDLERAHKGGRAK